MESVEENGAVPKKRHTGDQQGSSLERRLCEEHLQKVQQSSMRANRKILDWY